MNVPSDVWAFEKKSFSYLIILACTSINKSFRIFLYVYQNPNSFLKVIYLSRFVSEACLHLQVN